MADRRRDIRQLAKLQADQPVERVDFPPVNITAKRPPNIDALVKTILAGNYSSPAQRDMRQGGLESGAGAAQGMSESIANELGMYDDEERLAKPTTEEGIRDLVKKLGVDIREIPEGEVWTGPEHSEDVYDMQEFVDLGDRGPKAHTDLLTGENKRDIMELGMALGEMLKNSGDKSESMVAAGRIASEPLISRHRPGRVK